MKRTALHRSKRLKTRRSTPRRSGRVHNEAFLAAVRLLPCYSCGRPAPSEADHQGERPFGRKADDDTAVPMCGGPFGCHRLRTDGFIPNWRRGDVVDDGGYPTWRRANKDEMRVWCDLAIRVTRMAIGYVKAPPALEAP